MTVSSVRASPVVSMEGMDPRFESERLRDIAEVLVLGCCDWGGKVVATQRCGFYGLLRGLVGCEGDGSGDGMGWDGGGPERRRRTE